MTAQEQATYNNYLTLACEIVLYTYNDYIRDSINLFTLEHPDENRFTEARYIKLVNTIISNIRCNAKKEDGPLNERTIRSAFYRDLRVRKQMLRNDIEVCKAFFLDPSPIVGCIEINGALAIRKADEVVERWLATGSVEFLTSVRAERSAFGRKSGHTYAEDFDYE